MNLSLVVPVYNEKDNLPFLIDSIHEAMNGVSGEWEAVLVDDGSSDGSMEVLEALSNEDPFHLRVVGLRRNFGQTAAIAAGIDHSVGDIIVLLDADMQNDPADIPKMLEKIDEGYDLVSGWRIRRKDTFITRTLPSRIANWMISQVTGVPLHDYGCTLKAYRREVLTGFRLYGEMHRFIPVYAASIGAKIIEIPVQHHPRKFGKAKYGLERTIKVILDLFTVKFLSSFANKPIYIFGGTGLLFMASSFTGLMYLAVRRLFYNISPFTSPIFTVSIMIGILGFQSILMGQIAEMLMRTYHESQGKPTYTVRKILNIKPENTVTKRR